MCICIYNVNMLSEYAEIVKIIKFGTSIMVQWVKPLPVTLTAQICNCPSKNSYHLGCTFFLRYSYSIWKAELHRDRRGRERHIIRLLVHSPDAWDDQGWARSKLGTWNSILVPGTQVCGRGPSTWTIPHSFSRHIRIWIRSRTAGSQTRAHVGYQCHRQWLTVLFHNMCLGLYCST